MRAILLAAGFGTRLRPLTNTMPKCLMSIKGKVLLGIWLERLTQAGIGPFLVNTHYLADTVGSFVEASPFRDVVLLVHEKVLLGTAGTLFENLDFFRGEDGLLIHADNYCLADLNAFRQAHLNRPSECVMTMMIFQSDAPSQCGIVELDDRGVVTGFHEKTASPPGRLANGAVFILSVDFLDWVRDNSQDLRDFSKEIIPRFLGRIYTFKTNDVFVDIGTPDNYEKANMI